MQATPEQLVDGLQKQLLNALVSKEDAQTKLKEAETQIAAIRNVLAGVQVTLQASTKEQPQPPQEG